MAFDSAVGFARDAGGGRQRRKEWKSAEPGRRLPEISRGWLTHYGRADGGFCGRRRMRLNRGSQVMSHERDALIEF